MRLISNSCNLNPVQKIAVYCGSSTGNSPVYSEDAKKLANTLSNAGMTLIYGGAKIGLMGTLANQMLSNGSSVIGVMPKALVDLEIAHENLTELHIASSMHQRKQLIAELADAFIMLPGGPGSLDEFFEILTWGSLGHHQKPCAILNTAGYYDNLLKFLDHAAQQGFLKQRHREMIIVSHEPSDIIDKFINYQAPPSKWVDKLLETNYATT